MKRLDLADNYLSRESLLTAYGAPFLERYAALQESLRAFLSPEHRSELLDICQEEKECEVDPADDGYNKHYEDEEEECDDGDGAGDGLDDQAGENWLLCFGNCCIWLPSNCLPTLFASYCAAESRV